MTQNNSAKSTATPPGFSQFASFSSAPGSKSATPQPPAQQSAFAAPAAADPFAALGSSFSQPGAPPAAAPADTEDDEWSFSSALPLEAPPIVPKEHKVTVSNTDLKIDLLANRATGASNSLTLLFGFSNNSAQQITELHWQVAVTKVSCAGAQ